jgi:hypothetical protein
MEGVVRGGGGGVVEINWGLKTSGGTLPVGDLNMPGLRVLHLQNNTTLKGECVRERESEREKGERERKKKRARPGDAVQPHAFPHSSFYLFPLIAFPFAFLFSALFPLSAHFSLSFLPLPQVTSVTLCFPSACRVCRSSDATVSQVRLRVRR